RRRQPGSPVARDRRPRCASPSVIRFQISANCAGYTRRLRLRFSELRAHTPNGAVSSSLLGLKRTERPHVLAFPAHHMLAMITEQDFELQLRLVQRHATGSRAGVLGPDSVIWRINREAAIFLGAGRALLLQ